MIASNHQYRFAQARAAIYRVAITRTNTEQLAGLPIDVERLMVMVADLHDLERDIAKYERTTGEPYSKTRLVHFEGSPL